MQRVPLVVLLLLLLTTSVHGAAPGVYAITGGTVHPVSGPPIPNGIVLIRDGLIEAVGANIAVPPDATVIDAKGAHVYPGLIDAMTSMGFPAPRRPRRGPGQPQPPDAQREEPVPEPTPATVAARSVRISNDDAAARRATGVTTILTVPAAGIFNGQSVILNLGGAPVETSVIRSPAAMHVAFAPRPTWTYPDSLMGVVAHIRQMLLDAQQHASARAIYERNPAGTKRPEANASLEALAPVLSRELPVVFAADTDLAMRRALALAREFNLRPVLAGGRQAYKIAAELKAANVPLLVSVRWPVPPSSREDRAEQPLRVIRDRMLAPTSPAELAKAGVAFALVSGAARSSEFLPGIRKAIENGLSADDALRAVTISPARIFGVDRQLGSLERGKIANVVVSDKPIFEKQAKITRVFVDGRELRIEPDERAERAEAASPVEGTWNLTVRTPQGDVAIRVTLQLEDGKLTGTYSGDRGSGEIRSGRLDNGSIEFTITVSGSQTQETSDWVFSGTVRESSMEGTVSTNLGTFQFTGSKSR
ncbi:MAG TPA: amidohydrolase family protein [Thermoanaerobaculia bacterium]|nr:amidohydrolase family protein [Thermoanaerobaculia bacterium]